MSRDPCCPANVRPGCRECSRFVPTCREARAQHPTKGGHYWTDRYARRGVVLDATTVRWPGGVCPMRQEVAA